jgi:hypothetical protein
MKSTPTVALYCTMLVLTMILVGVFAIPLSSAWDLSIDNIKEYDAVTKTVQIWDKDIFGTPKTLIGEATLKTDFINNVGNSKNELIFEIEANNVYEQRKFIDGMEFYDVKTGKPIDKKITWKYATINYRNVTDYKTTIIKEGIQYKENIIGSHLEAYRNWKIFDEKAENTKGITYLGGFTDVEVGESTEFIPTLWGEKISEWAIFNGVYWVYDEIDDSSINTSLWNVGANGDGGPSEDGDRIKTYCTGGNNCWINTTNMSSDTSGMMNITFRAEISCNDGGGSGGTTAYSGISVFGTDIISISRADSTGSGAVIDDSNWTLKANGTDWDVYNDNVYISKVTPTNNNISIWGSSGSTNVDVRNYIYYLYYATSIPTTSLSISNTLISPTNNTNYSTSTITFSGNATAINGNVTNMTLYIWNGGTTTNITTGLTEAFNSTTWVQHGIKDGTNIWNVYACGTNVSGASACSWDSVNRTLIINTTQSAVGYPLTIIEGESDKFVLNITTSLNASTILANLTYNNTIYPMNINFSNDTFASLTATFNAPFVSSDTNVPWNITYGVNWNVYSVNGTQLVYNIPEPTVSTSCGDLNTTYTFSLFDEANLTSLNGTFKYKFSYGISNPNSVTVNGTITNAHSFNLCVNNSVATNWTLGNGEIFYTSPGYADRRYYLFNNTKLLETTTPISMYSLLSTSATSFLYTAQSTSLAPYIGYYLSLMRWYPDINSYNVVELAKTDDKGQSVLHVKTEDVDYRVGVYARDGTLIQLLNPIRFVCQTQPCTYSIFVDTNPLDLTTFTNIQSSLTFDETTKVFTYVWNDPSQKTQLMNLTVWKDTGVGSTAVCNSFSSGYTGVMSCNVSAEVGNLRATVVRTASPLVIIASLSIKIGQTIIDVGGGALSLFFGAMLLIFFALVGTVSPILVVILGIVSLIPVFLLGGISWAVLTAIGVIGGLILYFMKRI